MPKDVRLPQLGQTMEEGTFVACLVKEGDAVKKGDVLFEVETDKATLEMESPVDGVVKKILIEIGQTVPVGTPVLVLGEADEAVSQSYLQSLTGGAASAPASATAQAPSEPAAKPATAPTAGAAAPATPAGAPAAAPQGVRVVPLPQLGQTMEEGTLVSCLVSVGDEVHKGDVLFEIETDKATLEMESPADGFVKAIVAEVGQTLPIQAPLLILGPRDVDVSSDYIAAVRSGTAGAAPTPGQVESAAAPQAAAVAEAPPVENVASTTPGRVFATPRARLVAAELGVGLSGVTPAAQGLRIVEADVRQAAASGKTPVTEAGYRLGQRIPMNRLQRIVGEKMLLSKQTIPCFYLNIQVDMTAIVKLRERMNKGQEVKISFNDFLIKAVALGLRHYPIMTGQLDGDAIVLAPSIDVGLAIATPSGLVAPIVKNAVDKSLREISVACKGLIERARADKLSLDDLTGGCITVSNLGGFGIDSFIPIVVPGQTSILGVGRIRDMCVPIDGNILVRKMMHLNLSVDHKVANGADAAQFLDFVKKTLEHAEDLAD
jgi:pyruvate dehydrogenase E2 component (dihydrolipoamide acetyltransferase)